ncbi:hypothetical protein M501DRAFT_996893 [Patellaria atrata CBS 101060]|uniref:Uncharacterized protein n=1 Tax=Patellaria atrata CBS 101060 TaxID=1346257 RepID=A0A9P4S6H6_9PEZI|nr:hypothetical protein M501DRAFT_996893 [Patellaria atrata CBS 101060]
MASKISERWLWFGLGISALVILKGIIKGGLLTAQVNKISPDSLQNPRDNILLEHSNPKPEEPTSIKADVETLSSEGIKLSALQALACSENPDIRKAARRILVDRFIHNPTARLAVVTDFFGPYPSRRASAALAMRLIDQHAESGWRPHPQQYQADAASQSGESNTSGTTNEAPQTTTIEQGRVIAARRRILNEGIENYSSGTRQSEGNPEERARRRRRREAMVLNEGDQPVSQADIWVPSAEGVESW